MMKKHFIIALLISISLHAQDINELIQQGQIEQVTELLQKKPQLVFYRKDGLLPLDQAAKTGNVEIGKLLLQFSASLDAYDNLGFTALHHAVKSGNYAFTQFLLDAGAGIHLFTSNGNSALQLAEANDHRELALLLIERGAQLSILFGQSRPILSAEQETAQLIRMQLVANDSLFSGIDRYDLDYVIYALEKMGAQPNARNLSGQAAVLYAVLKGFDAAVKVLVERGANPDIRDRQGRSARSVIEENYAVYANMYTCLNPQIDPISNNAKIDWRDPFLDRCEYTTSGVSKFVDVSAMYSNPYLTEDD